MTEEPCRCPVCTIARAMEEAAQTNGQPPKSVPHKETDELTELAMEEFADRIVEFHRALQSAQALATENKIQILMGLAITSLQGVFALLEDKEDFQTHLQFIANSVHPSIQVEMERRIIRREGNG